MHSAAMIKEEFAVIARVREELGEFLSMFRCFWDAAIPCLSQFRSSDGHLLHMVCEVDARTYPGHRLRFLVGRW